MDPGGPPPGLGPRLPTQSAQWKERRFSTPNCVRSPVWPGEPPTSGQLPDSRLNRPMSARFNAVARRVAKDHAGPYCTMKVGKARGFCAKLRDSGQTGLLGRFQVGQHERKEEMKACPPDAESFV